MAISNGQTISAADILGMVSFQVASGTTLSLTTVASEKVLVIAKGTCQTGGTSAVTLNYNGVQKDQADGNNGAGTGSGGYSFCLMYTETPGAATHNVTIGGGNLVDCVIIVVHLKQS